MNQYDTNIINLTCSCEDWKQTRKDYPTYNPRRLCKHIIARFQRPPLGMHIKA
jgi:hypothetical protein